MSSIFLFSGFGDSPIKLIDSVGSEVPAPANPQFGAGGCGGVVVLDSGVIGVSCFIAPADGDFYEAAWSHDLTTMLGGETSPTIAGSDSIATNGTNYYSIFTAATTKINKFDATGAFVSSWTVGGVTGRQVLGMQYDEAVAYYGSRAGDTVFKFVTGTLVSTTFVTRATKKIHDNTILVLSNNEVLIGWNGAEVIRYNTSGVPQATYSLSGSDPSGNSLVLTRAANDPDSFWVSYYVMSTTLTRVSQIRIGDGAVIASFDLDLSGGFEFDGPFAVYSTDARWHQIIQSGLPNGRQYGTLRSDYHALAVRTSGADGALALSNDVATDAKAFTARVQDDGTPTLECNGPSDADIEVNARPTAWMHKAVVTLTNAQIKSLPGTPVQIVAVAPAGYRNRLISASALYRFISTPYTGINTSYATLVLQVPGGEWLSGVLANDDSLTVDLTSLTDWLAGSADAVYDFPVPYLEAVYDAGGANLWIQSIRNTVPADLDNAPIELALDNNGSTSDLGGGNAGNTLRITAYYTIEALP